MKKTFLGLEDMAKFPISFLFNKNYTGLNDLFIDISSRCNLNCESCETRKIRGKGNFMDKNNFKDIIYEASDLGLESVHFGFKGEPTLHPDFKEIVDFCSDKGLRLSMITNLNVKEIEKLEAFQGFERVIASIYSVHKEKYEKIQGGNFELVFRNLEYLSNEGITPEIEFLVQKKNYKEVSDAIDSFSIYEPPSINFYPVSVKQREKSNVKGVSLSETEFRKYIKYAGEAFRKLEHKDIISTPFIVPETLKKYQGLIRNKGYEEFELEFRRREFNENFKPGDYPCIKPWFSLLVGSDSKVYPCDLAYNFDKGSIADLKDTSLKKLWNSKKISDYRKKLKERNKFDFCKHCIESEFRRGKKILGALEKFKRKMGDDNF